MPPPHPITMGEISVPSIPSRKTKSLLLDSVSCQSLAWIGLFYACAFITLVIIGVTGPKAILTSTNEAANAKVSCAQPGECNKLIRTNLVDITPMHQMVWLTLSMKRPIIDGKPILLPLGVPFSLNYQLDVLNYNSDGSSMTVVENVTHSVRGFCRPDALSCDSVLIFAETDLSKPVFDVRLRVQDVFNSFSYAIPANSVVNTDLDVTMGYFNKDYTAFEVGLKLFFFSASATLWFAYSLILCTGPGTRDEETGQRLATSPDQAFVWWLCLFLTLYNDPTFLLYLQHPTIELAGFSAFGTVTFLTSLLFFWLVQLDLMRLQGENGLFFHLEPELQTKLLGVWFWLPKIIFLTVFWTISIAFYMYQRIMVIQDPAFNIIEANPAVSEYFFKFISAMAGLYLVYFFALLVLNYRSFGTMRPVNRFVLLITVFTLIVVFVGIFLNLNSTFRSEAALIMVAYGACNLYVWLLTFAMVPGERSPMWVREMLNRGNVEGSAAERHQAQLDEQGEIDTQGVLGGNEDEEYDYDVDKRQHEADHQEDELSAEDDFEARAQQAAAEAAEKRKRTLQSSSRVPKATSGRGRASGRKPLPEVVIDVDEEEEEEEEENVVAEEAQEEEVAVEEKRKKFQQPPRQARPLPSSPSALSQGNVSISPKSTGKINFAAAAAAAQKPVVRKV
jgi:hypothetical protein